MKTTSATCSRCGPRLTRSTPSLLTCSTVGARCAQQVGEIKAQHGEAGIIYRPEREARVLRRLQDINPGPLSNESVT